MSPGQALSIVIARRRIVPVTLHWQQSLERVVASRLSSRRILLVLSQYPSSIAHNGVIDCIYSSYVFAHIY